MHYFFASGCTQTERMTDKTELIAPPPWHVKTGEQVTIIQYGDWYTGRWWVGCYLWYSDDGSGRTAAPPSPLFVVPNVAAHPSTASVPTSYYSMWHYNQRLYLFNKLKHAGLDEQGLATVFQAIVVYRVLYALPAWFGQLTQLDIGHINGLFRKAHRWQLAGRVYTVERLAGTADAGLFKAIASNPNHTFAQWILIWSK